MYIETGTKEVAKKKTMKARIVTCDCHRSVEVPFPSIQCFFPHVPEDAAQRAVPSQNCHHRKMGNREEGAVDSYPIFQGIRIKRRAALTTTDQCTVKEEASVFCWMSPLRVSPNSE